MIKALVIPFLILGLTFPANLLASNTEPLPEFAYSFAEKGTTLTLEHDVYILLPDAWALINTEYEAMQSRWQLKYDTDLSLKEARHSLEIDLRDLHIDYLNKELGRTNDLLIETQETKTLGDYTSIIVGGSFILGVLSTTALVFALTKGQGVQ
jgi:hypothetical protein